MVQKAATAGVALLAAVSAPTALAIRLAEDCGLTLVGFARHRQHVVYAHGARLTD
jgi:FdhD protein